MSRIELNRRDFLKGCCATAAAGAVGPSLLFSPEAQAAANTYDTVVLVFLRGGIDGLNLVVPTSGNDRSFYEQARPNLAIAASGTYGALPLTLAGGAATPFGLHPSATGLRDIWEAGKLAIVHSCGMPTVVTRSHFNAQLFLDFGTPGRASGTGWMARALDAQAASLGQAAMPALATNDRVPANLLGSTEALVMGSPADFALNAGAWQWQTRRSGMPAGARGVNEMLARLWKGNTGLEYSGARADAALQVVATQPYTTTLPAGWPDSGFARQLWTIAQSIRFNLGLRYATLDLGGWDTHDSQGSAGSGYHYYQNKIAELSQALTAFYSELSSGGEMSRVTVVVQSEFGRRVRENGSRGTDHGYGNPLLVLGGPVNGRRFYGSWMGLDPEVLSPYFGDVPATTDFRRVFSELLVRRMGISDTGVVFPEYVAPAPLGIVQNAVAAATASHVVSRQPATVLPTHDSAHRTVSTARPRPARLPRPVDSWTLRIWIRLLRWLFLRI
ncbi:DUF1501 domain-containing protein [Lysobacter sp. M15]|uniref:DUF1501 domain-containing protein n=1 Tax=Lysobacter sp. M15 TaxID=2916837 RepID=UPI001F589E37|nr:DUF1501 domain-containing protein [Lysobacter sp. M15]